MTVDNKKIPEAIWKEWRRGKVEAAIPGTESGLTTPLCRVFDTKAADIEQSNHVTGGDRYTGYLCEEGLPGQGEIADRMVFNNK
jgi:hypothetical protein